MNRRPPASPTKQAEWQGAAPCRAPQGLSTLRMLGAQPCVC